MQLSEFTALSFDCYGTLIDWETGIGAVLEPWAAEAGLELTTEQLLTAYADQEARIERESPGLRYPEVLAAAFTATGARLDRAVEPDWADRLARSVPDWPAFDDSAAALARLADRYQLIILSNVHRAGFAGSNERLGVRFDAIITAEDVGAYKPALAHFHRLDEVLVELGVPRSGLLHVAQSLFHDHAPARQVGLPSVWINRRHGRPGFGATPEPSAEYSFGWQFPSLAAFTDAALGPG